KTVNEKLPDDQGSLDNPKSQVNDNLKMVSKEVNLEAGGQTVTIKKLKYVFTTTKGAQKNLKMISDILSNSAYEKKVSFDVFNTKGQKMTISAIGDLSKPEFSWLQP